MTTIECTGWIKRVMALEGKEPEIRRLVEGDAQRFQRVPQRDLGRRRRMFVEPQRTVAADVAALNPVLAAPNARGAEFTARVAAPGLGRERSNDRRRQEIPDDCESRGGDGSAHAGNRGRDGG